MVKAILFAARAFTVKPLLVVFVKELAFVVVSVFPVPASVNARLLNVVTPEIALKLVVAVPSNTLVVVKPTVEIKSRSVLLLPSFAKTVTEGLIGTPAKTVPGCVPNTNWVAVTTILLLFPTTEVVALPAAAAAKVDPLLAAVALVMVNPIF